MNDSLPNAPFANTPSAQLVSQATVDTTNGFFGINIDIGATASTLNYFTLAWCILYTFILVTDFFFWRVLYTNLEIPRMKRGEKSLFDSAKIWGTYLLVAFAFMVYSILYDTGIGSVVGMFVIAGFVIKLIFDLPLIPVLSTVPNAIIDGIKKSAKAVTPELPAAKEEKPKH